MKKGIYSIIPCFKKQGLNYVFRKMSYMHKCIETNLEGYACNSNRTGIGSCQGVSCEQDFSHLSTSVLFEILQARLHMHFFCIKKLKISNIK